MKILYLFLAPVLFLILSGALPAGQSVAKAEPSAGDEIVLTFLGTGAPRPSTRRYGPGILVEAGSQRILVDAGSGIRERLFQAGGFSYITGIDHIFITHLHFDHTVSVPDLWLSGWLYGRRVPMRVRGPVGTKAMMDHFQKAYQWDIDYRVLVGVPQAGSGLQASDIEPGIVYDSGGLKVTAFEVAHMPINPQTGELLGLHGQTLGFRIDYRGRSVVFSGDTRSTRTTARSLIEHGRGADVLIHEVQVPSPGETREARLANVSLSVHTTPEQAAYVFAETSPRLAVYSHIIPPDTTAEELVRATRPGYSGPLSVAHDLMTITIGDAITIGKHTPEQTEIFEESGVIADPAGDGP